MVRCASAERLIGDFPGLVIGRLPAVTQTQKFDPDSGDAGNSAGDILLILSPLKICIDKLETMMT